MLRDKAHHVVVVPVLFVHVDGEVRLADHDVELLGLLEAPRGLELLCLCDVEHTNLVLRHVGRRDLVRLVPLVAARVHLDSLLRLPRPNVVPLRLVVALGLLEVLRDDLIEALGNVGLLCVDNLHCLAPLTRLDRRLDRLNVLSGLYKVIDRRIKLLLRHEVHAPVVLQTHNFTREHAPRQLNRTPVRIPTPVRFERTLRHL
mmetsp:Transcript_11352/g.27843  ORF Transcript_11352/g.27843 Transcript_11352/m.27843 type:complete len:202 (-) Transcript_11352:2686-3291(-)